VSANYDWMKFYEAAVLETNPNVLPGRIEDAKDAIGQRVVRNVIDEAERRAVIKTLNALAVLKRERSLPGNPLCDQCKDMQDLVTPTNGKTFLAKTAEGSSVVSLHTRCVVDWADRNSFWVLAPMTNRRSSGQ
jgi:hypothetical protein